MIKKIITAIWQYLEALAEARYQYIIKHKTSAWY